MLDQNFCYGSKQWKRGHFGLEGKLTNYASMKIILATKCVQTKPEYKVSLSQELPARVLWPRPKESCTCPLSLGMGP
ncbi:hypothetical protein C0J52_00634 [Blattella germanica]|nr:hypothetical protein C0J52_00634 [Blattella germanica]